MGNVKWIDKEFVYPIAENFCNENGYSFEKLISLKFCKGNRFSFFGKYPNSTLHNDNSIHLDSESTMPEVPIMIYADGTVKTNDKYLYLIK